MKRVVLCRPSGPRNVGSIVRAVANFGPAELWIAAPQRASLLVHPEFTQMGHGAEATADAIVVVDTVEEALADCTHAVGFTARRRGHRDLAPWSGLAAAVGERCADDSERVALVFGNEQEGLLGSEADRCQELCHIETSGEHASLNLAVAVTVVLHTLFRESAPATAREAHHPLRGADRAFLVERAAKVLAEHAWTEPARRDVAAAVRRTLERAPIEARDARGWHLLLRALGNEDEPSDLGVEDPPAPDADR